MESLNYYYKLIENVIRRLGVDPQMCKNTKEGQYDLKKGSARVWIDVWKVENENYGYLQIMAPVVEIPNYNCEDFYREILDINHKLFGVAMTAFENMIYIKVTRELEGLSEDEAFALFNRIGTYADDYDDILRQKYHHSL